MLVCGAFWKLTLSGDYTWANQSDMADQVLPWLQMQAREWQSGRPFPLWDPYQWGGQSLVGQLQTAVFYPWNWVLYLWPLGPDGSVSLRVLGWWLVLARFTGAAFFYALVRDLGRSRLAAVFGGVLFACTGYVGTTEWPQVVNGAIWFPLVLLFGLRVLRYGRWTDGVFLGSSLGMALLAGHYQVPAHMLLCAAGLVLARLRGWRVAPWVAVSFVLLAAVQLWPAREFWQESLRWIGNGAAPLTGSQKVPFAVHVADSLDPVSLTGVFVPRIYTALANPYLGFAGVVLAVFGLAATWRSWVTRVVAGVALVFVLVSFGAATWLYGVAYVLVPGLDKARHPAAAVAIWHPCLVLLAAIGLDWVRRLRVRWRSRAAWVLFAFAGYVLAVTIYLSLAEPPKTFGRNEQTMAAFTALLLGGALLGFRNPRLAFVAVALIEVSNVAGYSYFSKSAQGWAMLDPLYGQDRDVVEFLRREPGFVRVDFDRGEIPYNFGDWWGVAQYQGYMGVRQAMFERVFAAETKALFGVSHWISKSPGWEGKQPVFTSARGLYVYRLDTKAEGAAFFVPSVAGCEVKVDARMQGAGRWRVEVGPRACAGEVVLRDGWDSGWAGSAATTVRPYQSLLVGFPVQAGTETQWVGLRYRPRAVTWGVCLSCLGVVLAAYATWTTRRRVGAGRPAATRTPLH
ncbi:hypothetical protein F183_A44870 [Bryobacterales bacterium F-183]|nr:hypothetical protein F183_A44870 [Bryobacterales bacterium F-183]